MEEYSTPLELHLDGNFFSLKHNYFKVFSKIQMTLSIGLIANLCTHYAGLQEMFQYIIYFVRILLRENSKPIFLPLPFSQYKKSGTD